MKIKTLSNQIVAGAALALVTFGVNTLRAVSVPSLQNADGIYIQESDFQAVSWEAAKLDKLRHAYQLLEHADGDYAGHREEAMKSIKKAAELLGADLKWRPRGEEAQWKTDRRLREAKHLLQDLVIEAHGKEQPHIHHAIKEIDKALATR